MRYIIPDYYKEFRCTAHRCEDTCCAGWQIVIDRKSLKDYGKVKGTFRKKVYRSIDFLKGTFRQDTEKRCAFLNEDNLCDLYANLGEKSLCRTCRLYPRHIEEFEGVREISLSVSCPEVAGILMRKEEPVKFLTYEKEGEEEYEDFDPFLYSMLLDAQDAMMDILQNRRLPLRVRCGLILGMAHDIQGRVNRQEIFGCEDVIARYQTEQAERFVKGKAAEVHRYEELRKWMDRLHQLELLRGDWKVLLYETQQLLYQHDDVSYEMICEEYRIWREQADAVDLLKQEIQLEQLLVYFLHVYFCGAVYDGRIYTKVQMAVLCAALIGELWIARWVRNEKQIDQEEIAELVYRFSREVEHSDENLKRLEKMVEKDVFCWFRKP